MATEYNNSIPWCGSDWSLEDITSLSLSRKKWRIFSGCGQLYGSLFCSLSGRLDFYVPFYMNWLYHFVPVATDALIFGTS